jgi:hypothetical protein
MFLAAKPYLWLCHTSFKTQFLTSKMHYPQFENHFCNSIFFFSALIRLNILIHRKLVAAHSSLNCLLYKKFIILNWWLCPKTCLRISVKEFVYMLYISMAMLDCGWGHVLNFCEKICIYVANFGGTSVCFSSILNSVHWNKIMFEYSHKQFPILED